MPAPLLSIEVSLEESYLLGVLLQLPFVIHSLQSIYPDFKRDGQINQFLQAKQALLEKKWIALQEDGCVAIEEDIAFFFYAIEACERVVEMRNDNTCQVRYVYLSKDIGLEQESGSPNVLTFTLLEGIEQLLSRQMPFLDICPVPAGLQEICMPGQTWNQAWQAAQIPHSNVDPILIALQSTTLPPETAVSIARVLLKPLRKGTMAFFARKDFFLLDEIIRISWLQSAEQSWSIRCPLTPCDNVSVHLSPASGATIQASIAHWTQSIFEKVDPHA